MKNLLTLSMILALSIPGNGFAKSKNHLSACWEKQVEPLGKGYIHFSYTESKHQQAHLSEPWQTYHIADTGSIWCNGDKFLKTDTSAQWGDIYYSKTQLSFTDSELLFLGYGDKELSKVTRSMIGDEPVDEARYSPTLLINYFHGHGAETGKEKNKHDAIYSLNINKKIVRLFISKKDNLLVKVTTFENSDLYGDVTTTIDYTGFTAAQNIYYAATVNIHKLNGEINDTVTICSATVTDTAKPLLERAAGYKLTDEKVTVPGISTEKYNDHIHFITLKHTNGRAMVVEFHDFLLVAEAPLNSANGELIINEAKKIAPGKPIRYFVFGHHHPDYIGGIRAFIHRGATVLCTNGDLSYVTYLANAPHTLQPDSLELQPHALKTEEIGEQKTITDGKYEMDIYLIGAKSAHTNDYLIYYFPQEKMLFEDDLAAISEKGPTKKAGKRQAGLYHAIKDLNLDVATIEQSWPVGYGMKTGIPFMDLEESVNLK